MKPTPMYNKIAKLCRAIEKEEKVTILFAVENGSRAWRMESADSDYDVRFVYHRPLKEYLNLTRPKEVIEKFYDAKSRPLEHSQGSYIDMVGHDVFKFLTLLSKSNPTAIEWLVSDIVYYGEQNKVFKKFALENFSKKALFYHYHSICKKMYLEYTGRAITGKKYLYSLRGLVNAKYVQQFGKIPPIRFTQAVRDVSIAEDVKNKCFEIIKLKQKGKEKEVIGRIGVFDNYIEKFIAANDQLEAPVPADLSPLETELRKILLGDKFKSFV